MEKCRLIAFDLDGTLLRSDRTVSDRTKAAMTSCVKAGAVLAMASGRAISSLPQELLSFPGIEYAITSNGAAVYRIATGERILHFPLEAAAAEPVLMTAREGWQNYEVFVDGIPYGREDYVKHPWNYGITSEHSIRYIQTSRRPVENLEEFAWEHRGELDCVSIRVADGEQRKLLEEQLQQLKGIMYTASMPLLVEVGHPCAGKGNALKHLARMLDIPREEVVAFGNEENDMGMMQFAGVGVAVGNSSDFVKSAADVVTDGNDEDGVAAYMEKIYKDRK